MVTWLKRLATLLTVLVLLLLLAVGPIDTTPLQEQSFYQSMMAKLDTLKPTRWGTSVPLEASWGKINITPGKEMPMAGYRVRPRFVAVHDSLFARVLLVTKESSVYIITLDLLIFPPALKEKLELKLAERGRSAFLYLGATHTHNGIGGWHDSPAGEIILGEYDPAWIDDLANRMIELMDRLNQEKKAAKLFYWETSAQEYVENRLSPGAPADGLLRGIHLTRADSTEARLITFSAHPTNISKTINQLSGDYPAFLVNQLEKRKIFGLFMAGMVGSHRLSGLNEPETGFVKATRAGQVLAEKVLLASLNPISNDTIYGIRVPIEFGPAQLRLTEKVKLRNWLFSWAFGSLQGELTFLQIGNVRFVGTPCDFSGEIFITQHVGQLSQHAGPTIITSFNGNYVGYITEDAHYSTVKKEEVMAMNWVGPYYGKYFTDMITQLRVR